MKLEFGEFRVLTLRETPPPDVLADEPSRVAEYWRTKIATDPRHNPDVESLVGLCLNTRRRVIGHYVVSTGLLDSCQFHPREVFRPAIVGNAAAIVLIHNHPSGDPTPSEADIKMTRELIRAGQCLKVDVLDHVIMGAPSPERPKDYCSLRELGYFYS